MPSLNLTWERVWLFLLSFSKGPNVRDLVSNLRLPALSTILKKENNILTLRSVIDPPTTNTKHDHVLVFLKSIFWKFDTFRTLSLEHTHTDTHTRQRKGTEVEKQNLNIAGLDFKLKYIRSYGIKRDTGFRLIYYFNRTSKHPLQRTQRSIGGFYIYLRRKEKEHQLWWAYTMDVRLIHRISVHQGFNVSLSGRTVFTHSFNSYCIPSHWTRSCCICIGDCLLSFSFRSERDLLGELREVPSYISWHQALLQGRDIMGRVHL